jgi:glutaryl-CoA dehydrogenase
MLDFYRLDDLLSEEQKIVRQTARAFVRSRVLPIIREAFTEGRFPEELIRPMGEQGFLGANLEGYGCAGLDPIAYGLIMQEFEAGDSGIRSFASVQGSLVMYPIWRYGSEEQRERWLPALARGEKVGCFGLTEPDFGSNPAGIRTRAERTSAGFLLNGAKMWITNGNIADVAVVWAKLDGTIRGFLVERGTPGFTVNEIRNKWSLRASVTSELVFEDCEIPESNLLPESNGLRSPLSCLNEARYGIAWGAVGAAQACYEEALSYALQRVQFTRPIAGYQLIQERLVYMVSEITKAQLLAWRLGQLKEQGRATPPRVSLAKRNNVDVALTIARMGRDILGASGITDEYVCGRHMANLESVRTYEGTHEMQTLIVGREITGLNAFT